MDIYAKRHGGTPNAYRFIFDGNRVVDTATPDDVCWLWHFAHVEKVISNCLTILLLNFLPPAARDGR